MDSIETAIRNALEKGNAEDEAFRAKIYRSALAALQRVVDEQPGLSAEDAIARRDALTARIAEIEAEFAPAVAAPMMEPRSVSSSAAVSGPIVEPPSRASTAPPPRGIQAPGTARAEVPEPRIETNDYAESQGYPDFDVLPNNGAAPYVESRDSSRRRRPFSVAFLVVTVLALLGIGAWWSVSSGLFLSVEQRSSGIASRPATLDEESASAADAPKKEGEADAEQNWITIFSPVDATSVTAPADAKADVLSDGDIKFLKIRSGPSGAETTFDVGQGILEKIAGHHAIFDVVARAEEGKDTQISVACNFGSLGNCDRKRYLVTNQRSDFLFEMDVPDKQPTAGTIAVNSDVDKRGKAVDLFEIRVSIAQ